MKPLGTKPLGLAQPHRKCTRVLCNFDLGILVATVRRLVHLRQHDGKALCLE